MKKDGNGTSILFVYVITVAKLFPAPGRAALSVTLAVIIGMSLFSKRQV